MKKNFPENALYDINQAYFSTVKSGALAIYCPKFILGQLLVVANQPENINKRVCIKNEVKLINCLYDTLTGEFKGLRMQLAYINLRGDEEELFFSYAVHSKESSVLYSVAEKKSPNSIVSTSFQKHYHEIMNKRRHNEGSSSFCR